MSARLVTLVFTDLVNSTAVKSRLPGDDVTARNQAYLDTVLAPHRSKMEAELAARGGRIVKTEGDAYFLAFDDAAQAARWALGAQRSHREDPIATPLGPLAVKIGMHTGAPLVDPVDANDYVGREVDYAARVSALAHGGQIVVSEASAALIRAADMSGITLHAHGMRELKGIGPVPIFELLAAGQQPGELKEAVHAPSNLPAPPKGFTGREQMLLDLRQRLSAGGVVILKGEGGIGKTSLALRIAHDAFSAGLLPGGASWVNCELRPSFDDCMREMAQVFFGDRMEREHTEQCRGRVSEHLVCCGGMAILDNFETVAADHTLLRWLADLGAKARVIVTTRETPPGLVGHVVPVRELTRAESIQLFSDRAAEGGLVLAGQESLVNALCAAVGDQPLAIRLLAARAPRLPLPRLLERVERDLDVLKSQDPTLAGHHQSARACFALSFDHLSEPARQLLLRLSVLPDGAGVAIISAVMGTQDWDDAAEELVAASVWRLSGERYTVHPLVRQFALEQLGEGRAAAERLAALAVTQFLVANAQKAKFGKVGPEALKRALDWCEAELRNLTACAEFAFTAGEWAAIFQLSAIIFNFWQVRGHWSAAELLYEQALEATRRSGDRAAQARTLNHLGIVYAHQERWGQAEAMHQQALLLWRELGDKPGIGNTLKHLGLVDQVNGRLAESEAHCQEALALLRETNDRIGEAKTLAYLANVYRHQERFGDAEPLYQQSLSLSRQIGDRYDEADALGYLSQVYRCQSRWAEAEAACEQSVAIWRDFNDRYREAIALDDLGVILTDQKKWPQAQAALEQSVALFRERGNHRRAGRSLLNLARHWQARAENDRALECAREAAALLDSADDAASQAQARELATALAQQGAS